jgi:23S rRNA (guanosine2251-2'-O)-methyltransferase
MKVFGKNVVRELLSTPSKIKKIYLTSNFKDQEIIQKIKVSHVQYETMDVRAMNQLSDNNQGVMAIINDYEYVDYHKMFNDNIIVILDHLEDPHNFGAIIRTCESAGIKSIIIPKDRSVDVSPTVMKTSSGALEYVNIAMVNNLNNIIKDLKDNGFFIYGAEADGKNYHEISYADKVVLVIGSEGNGLSSLVRKSCDEIISLPMKGHVNSLNASVAAGILIYNIIK